MGTDNPLNTHLIAAIHEGAKLRLRPKVMTVATPVIGGMLSSLLHILIVIPVIFLWIHQRKLRAKETAKPRL